MPAAIWGGLIFHRPVRLAGREVQGAEPHLAAVAALFLSLAYNSSTTGSAAAASKAGFLVNSVVFVLMGAVPMIWALPLWRVYVHGRDDPKPWHVAATGSAVGSAVDAMKILNRLGRSPNQDMTESLERLDELHKAARSTTSSTRAPRIVCSAGGGG